jgi:hypothetical protein
VCPVETPFDPRGFSISYKWLRSGDFIADRDFYLLALLETDPDARQAVREDGVLGTLTAGAVGALKEAAEQCAGDRACVRGKMFFTEQQVTAAGGSLVALFGGTAAGGLVQKHLIPSGAFIFPEGTGGQDVVGYAWTKTVHLLQQAFDDYSPDLSAGDMAELVGDVAGGTGGNTLFFKPILHLATGAMAKAGRDEAARYEPLDETRNATALERMKTVDWDAYPYAIILVPGQGPASPDVQLDPMGAQRCDLAAARYKAGLAPFIATSGGHVHPDRTPYSEAIEMKKYLMTQHGIPEDAVLVDPYARHTTTNLRNVTRMALRYGVPPDRKVLVTSDIFQSAYILGMTKRCMDELGYAPWRSIVKLADNDSCLVMDSRVLYVDASDPLDP